jgi:hypothetical protein
MFMMNFMSSSFANYKPLILFDRYMYPLFLPSLILVGGLLAALLEAATYNGSRLRGSLSLLIIALGIVGIGSAAGYKESTARPQQLERRVSVRLDKYDIVYTDFRTAANLVFFRTGVLSPSNATTRSWESVNAQQMPNGAYVLFNKSKVKFLSGAYKYAAPSFASEPPPSWKLIWTYDNADLYLVGSNQERRDDNALRVRVR